MCGIIGIVGKSEVASALYDALTVLQHRGQDAAGIATIDGNRLRLHKGPGLVRDVFTREAMLGLRGNVGIGHCRYPTAGSEGSAEAQPLYVNSPYGIALVPQRQPDQHRSVAPRDVRGRPPPHQHRFRFGDPAQRARARAADPGPAGARRRTTSSRPSPACMRAASAAMHRSRCCSATACSRSAIRTASVRSCSASARPAAARNTRSRPNRSRSTSSASSCCATSRPAKRC